jgi:photosystem II stability/assembly factor-like uncharacterized protein
MQNLPKIVRLRLGGGQAGPHPDPDLLAAFAENSLLEREREIVVSHLSRCGDCRAIVALAQPVADTIPVLAVERTSWLRWPVLKWGAAVACVAVVGAAVSLYRDQPGKFQAMRRAETATPSEARQQTVAEPVGEKADLAKPAAAAGRTDTAALALSPAAPAQAPARFSNALAKAAATPPESRDKISGVNEVEKKEMVVAGKAKDAPAQMSGATAANAGLMDRKSAASDVSLASALTPRWTLNADGTLQRSLDGGKTWSKIPVSANVAFRVVSALGSDVWVGGAAGTLFHSVDAGENWSQVKLSDGKRTLADDITAIQFTDSSHGKITSANDEVWSTDDGGSTWQQLW